MTSPRDSMCLRYLSDSQPAQRNTTSAQIETIPSCGPPIPWIKVFLFYFYSTTHSTTYYWKLSKYEGDNLLTRHEAEVES